MDSMSQETQIEVIKTKLETIDRSITEINGKLDRAFVTKQELANVLDRMERFEKRIDGMETKVWALIMLVAAELIRLLFTIFK